MALRFPSCRGMCLADVQLEARPVVGVPKTGRFGFRCLISVKDVPPMSVRDLCTLFRSRTLRNYLRGYCALDTAYPSLVQYLSGGNATSDRSDLAVGKGDLPGF